MLRNRRKRAACLAALVFALTCAAVLMLPDKTLSGGRAAAQTTPSATPTPVPWQNDPLGSPSNYTLFRDDNLFIAGEVAYPPGTYPGNDTSCNNATLGYFNQSFNAKPGSSFDGFNDAVSLPQQATGHLSNLRIVGGSGRILKPDSEQGVIYKLSDFQGSGFGQATYSVELFDKTGSLFTHTFPAVLAGNVSHLDVAAGDLDRLRNTGNQYQDEVVLVSESGNKTMQLTVLNFSNGADDTWTHCADEWGNCAFAGTARVRFGANGTYNYANFTNGVQCSYNVFGDPLVGTNKSCDYQIPPPAGSWTRCADENGNCAFAGTARVRFGANGTYNYGTFTGSVNCSNDVFSDPLVGTGKFCDYQIPQAPLITTIDTKIPVDYFADDPFYAPNSYNRGGQISVAVGDLDGDGKMEIAAVTVSNNAQLVLSLYRYTNDGKGNAQITLSDSQAITDVYQYADIAAGDFTGAGHDQVIIARVGTDQPEHNINSAAYDITRDAGGSLKIGNKLSEMTYMNSSRNLISSQCTGNWNCNDFITQPGWVQIKAGLFKYDPFNGYDTRRRQVALVYGNSRPIIGMIEIPPGSTTLRWLDPGPKNVDGLSGSGYCVSCTSPSNRGEVPDTREAYTIMAGNFGGLNPQNPAWQFAVATPYRTSNTPSEGCSAYPYSFYYVNLDIAAYQYTQGNGTTDSPYTFSLQNLSAPASVETKVWTKRTIGSRGVAAVALDLDGNSMRLGAPIRMVVDNLTTADAVLQEPPKHLDWVCSATDFLNPAKCDFVNVSRYKDFNLSYTDESSAETSNEVKSTADSTVGQSNAKSSQESTEIGKGPVSLNLDFDQKWETESDTKTSQENYSKSTTKQGFKYDSETSQADQIYSRTRSLVVFRYPLYGKPDPNNPGQQKFYDLTLPVETDINSSPGDTSEWYQPIHENGNLLTYPYSGTDSAPGFDPSPDYGFYTVGGAGQCSVSKSLSCHQDSDCPTSETCAGALPGLLGAPVTNTWGSNASSNGITYDQAGTTGASLSTSQTTKSSDEFKYGFKVSWKLPLEVVDVGGSAGGSFQYNTSKESTWSQASVSESTTTSAKGVNVKLPSITTPYDYKYKTWAYITQGGFLKVAHAANILTAGDGSISDWYARTYGQTYDLSLNLPRKFLPDESNSAETGNFTLNTDISRKETKSISISDPSLPAADGKPAYIAGAVVVDPNASQGKKLQLNARVYNLSTAVPIAGTDPNVVARFELAPFNPATAAEGQRQTIAEVRVPAIDFYGNQATMSNCTVANNPDNYPVCNSALVSAPWDTSGLKAGMYRLYVVLDPNNALPNEYHEWQDRRGDPLLQGPSDTDPGNPVDDNRKDANGNQFYLEKGQNNEGWMYVNVMAPSADTLASRTPELSLPESSLGAIEFRNRLNFDRPTAHLNTPSRVRVQVDSDGDDSGNQHVLLYDQDPNEGGKPFAARLLRGVTKGANYLWVTYTPRKLGEQRLWARVIEQADDSRRGNNVDSVTINVLPRDTAPPTLEVSLTPTTLWPPNGRMIPVTAHITASDGQEPPPEIRLEAITHNEANDSSRDVAWAAFGTDDRDFLLRAQRDGQKPEGRVYAVVYSATDWAGNKTFATAYVTVPLDQGGDRR